MKQWRNLGPGLRAPDTELGVCVGWATSLAAHASVSWPPWRALQGGTSDPLCVIRGRKEASACPMGRCAVHKLKLRDTGPQVEGLGRLSPSDTSHFLSKLTGLTILHPGPSESGGQLCSDRQLILQ